MQKLFDRRALIPLTDLKKEVEDEAKKYLPDFIYDDNQGNLAFEVVPLHEVLQDVTLPSEVGITIKDSNREGLPCLTTDWSRHQLLQVMGAREKWFDSVSIEEQQTELNRRAHVLDEMMLRTMRREDDSRCYMLRGLVSNVYCDIPNTEIVEALVASMPEDAQVIRSFSGQTDRAFYAYIVLNQTIGLAGREIHPGLVIKNSEVGFTSMWVIPFLYFPKRYRVAVMEKEYLLRKIHRGKLNDMKASFTEALNNAAPLWQDIASKIPLLAKKLYNDEDECLEAMDGLIKVCGGSKLFAQQCRHAYKKKGYITHSAYNVFEIIVDVAGNTMDQNKAYAHNALAGAILLKLVL